MSSVKDKIALFQNKAQKAPAPEPVVKPPPAPKPPAPLQAPAPAPAPAPVPAPAPAPVPTHSPTSSTSAPPSESAIVKRQIGDRVMLFTETIRGPPATYKYSVEPIGFKKITFTFNFAGSENFVLVDTPTSPNNDLEAVVVANPYERSPVVTCQQNDKFKGGSLSMSMAWSVGEPDVEQCAKFIQDYDAKITTVIASSKSVFPPELSRTEIERRCENGQFSFLDLAFPPLNDSIFKTDPANSTGEENPEASRKTIVFRRATEFSDAAKPHSLFGNAINAADVKQGRLADQWLLCSMSNIAEQPTLVTNLFAEDSRATSNSGCYNLKICKNGKWVDVRVDNYFPCIPDAGPAYSQNITNDLWILLVEKAFAKLHGSYTALRNGWPSEGLIDLTGAPYKDFRFSDRDILEKTKDGSLWTYISESVAKRYIISCSYSGSIKAGEGDAPKACDGLVPGYSYAIVAAVTTPDGHRVAKFRNPWGPVEWTGDFGEESPLWTPQLKQEMGYPSSSFFWLTFEDLVRHFIGVNVSLVRPPGGPMSPWIESRHDFNYEFSRLHCAVKVPMYVLTVNEDNTELFVSVHQADKRIIGSPKYIDIGLTVLRANAEGSYDYIASSGNSVERQNQVEIPSLAAGEYLVVPTSTCCKIQQFKKDAVASGVELLPGDLSRPAVLVAHSSAPFTINEVPFNAQALKAAIELPVINDGAATDLFGNGTVILYTRKSGYAGISYVARNTKKTGGVSLTLDFSGSDNVTSQVGALVNEVALPPGQSKVMLHIAPAVDDQAWTCGWFCKAKSISDFELETLAAQEVEILFE